MNEKYRLYYRIGGGSFDEIYFDIRLRREWRILTDNNSVIDINIDEEIIIKFKYISVDLSFLREEVEVYKFLIKSAGISTVY
jgi:hypothetical protein